MESEQVLLEYLKEQYSQARQHETRQSAATSFLAGSAALVLGFGVKDGVLRSNDWWIGILIVLIGAASWWINRAHNIGNRFHTKLAGKTRRELEACVKTWAVKKPTELRKEALEDSGLNGPDIAIGKIVYRALQWIPIGVMLTGFAVIIIARFWFICN